MVRWSPWPPCTLCSFERWSLESKRKLLVLDRLNSVLRIGLKSSGKITWTRSSCSSHWLKIISIFANVTLNEVQFLLFMASGLSECYGSLRLIFISFRLDQSIICSWQWTMPIYLLRNRCLMQLSMSIRSLHWGKMGFIDLCLSYVQVKYAHYSSWAVIMSTIWKLVMSETRTPWNVNSLFDLFLAKKFNLKKWYSPGFLPSVRPSRFLRGG